MAKIGSLSFDILYKNDLNSIERAKKQAQDKIKDLNVKFGIKPTVTRADLAREIKDSLAGNKFKIDIVVDKMSTTKAVQEALRTAGVGNGKFTADDARFERSNAARIKADAYASAQAELTRKRAADASKAELYLASARERAARGANAHASASANLNSAMSGNIRIAGELRNQLMGLYSVYAAERFLRSVIEIGGKFEQQRIALGAIIGDGTKAETIFQRIKDLAIISPFSFMDLTGYAKQLTAFNIPYNELFDTTKRLADISAGLGVDMSRIILAYGQARSAAFLRGQELRQFTEAGIPMVQALADKFGALEGRVISAGEVMDMISKKKVSFSDVQDVLWEMTDDGGRFFNMQEKLADSLYGKWINLEDQWDIMLSSIAEGNNGALRGMLDIAGEAMEHWEGIVNVLTVLISTYGAYRVAILTTSLAQKASILVDQISDYSKMAKALGFATANQIAFNRAVLLNPYVAIAAAVGTVITAYIVFRKETVSTEDAIRNLNMELEKHAIKIQEEKESAQGYIKTMFDETKSIDQKRRAYEKLQDIYPTLFKNMTMQQALLRGEIDLMGLSAKAALMKAKVTNQIAYEDALKNEIEAEKAYNDAMSMSGGKNTYNTWKAKQDLDRAQQISAAAKKVYMSAATDYHTISNVADEAWVKVAKSMSKGSKSLIPNTDNAEGFEAYLDRLKESIDELEKKLKTRSKNNLFTKEDWTKTNEELEKTRKIYEALGGIEKEKEESTKDPEADKWKERIDLVKQFISEYEKYSETIGKDAALTKLKASPIFTPLFGDGFDPENPSAYLDEIIGKLNSSKKKQRSNINLAENIKFDINQDFLKKQADKALSDIEKYISDTTKKWNIYKQLIDAGSNKRDAATYAFGAVTSYEKESEELRSYVQKKMNEKGVDIPFTLTEQEAMDKFGGKNSPLYKELFNAWKEAKDAIEKDGLDIKIKEVTAINKYKSIAEKIKDLNEKYSPLTGASIGGNGELIGDESGMTPGQKALFSEYKEQLAELKGQFIELLPIWEKIFGDHTYQSYGQIQRSSDVVNQIIGNAQVVKNKDGKPTSYTSWYQDESGSSVNVSGQYAQLERLRKAFNDLYKEGLQKNPFATLAKNMKELFSKNSGGADEKSISERLAAIGESAAESADLVGSFAGQMSDMFDSLGNESMASAMTNVEDAMSSVSNIGQGFAKGGIVGGVAAAAGEAVKWIGKIAQSHDAKLDKAIKKSQQEAQKLQSIYEQIEKSLDRFLGSGTDIKLVDAENDGKRIEQLTNQINSIRSKDRIGLFDDINLRKYSAEVSKLEKRQKAYQEGGAYGYQQQLLKEQLAELEKQRSAEGDKKKSDQSKISDYDNQISELRDQIRYFSEDLANTLYGIDLKDWASQLGDALYEAWQKGEDGATAFKNKVADIMGSVMNEVLKVQILQPMMNDVRKALFGEDGESGYFGKDKKLDSSEVEGIAGIIMSGISAVDKYNAALNDVDKYLNKHGISLKDSGSSSGLSSSISSSITEDQFNLASSYLNSMRADLAKQLEQVRKYVSDDFPKISVLAQSQLNELRRISTSTAKNAEFAEEIRDMFNSVIVGTKKIHI